MKISLTQRARAQLRTRLAASNIQEPVVALVWCQPAYEEKYVRDEHMKTRVVFNKMRDGFWEIGFCEKTEVPPDLLRQIDGIDFVFEPSPVMKALDGKILDYQENNFVFVDP